MSIKDIPTNPDTLRKLSDTLRTINRHGMADMVERAADDYAALRERVNALEEALQASHECVNDMAYQAHNIDITDNLALARIKERWNEYDIVGIAAVLGAQK